MREIGKEMAEKSKGLFSPEDWNCKSCGNINWARRNTCNVCNAPRVNNSGQRTGYGGGYMERDEIVEYRDRGDSDDEFDEFGRKKKKFRKLGDNKQNGSTTVGPTSTSLQSGSGSSRPERGNEIDRNKNDKDEVDKDDGENEEEEEESGDDADLSKYDIWGAEDDSDTEREKTEKPSIDEKPSRDLAQASPASSHSASDSESDSDASSSSSGSSSASSSSSASEGSSTGSAGRSSRVSVPRSRSPDSNSRVPRARSERRRTSQRDGKGNERSRSPMVARS